MALSLIVPTADRRGGALWASLTGTLVPDTTTLMVALSCLTPAAIVLAAVVYRWSERRARERGLLDRTTGS
jgi:hypothetical protein